MCPRSDLEMKANETMNYTHSGLPSNFDGNKLSHAYIVSGDIADTLAMAAVCSGGGEKPCMNCIHCSKASRGIHPDIAIIDKRENKREIVIEQIREIKRDVIVVPNESEKKAYIINNAELMNANAQNAFLRILEEPPSHAVFILRTDFPAELLPTVRSRCVELKFRIDDSPADATILDIVSDFFSAMRLGNDSLIEFMYQLERLDKEQLAGFLTAARGQAAAELKASTLKAGAADSDTAEREYLSRAERVLAKAGEFLDFNVSVGHISGLICANLINKK